ncbi:MAG TPA: hypothetical protein VIJ87_09545 [Pyrinomonadaceae bacterium]
MAVLLTGSCLYHGEKTKSLRHAKTTMLVAAKPLRRHAKHLAIANQPHHRRSAGLHLDDGRFETNRQLQKP